jgi:ubiquinone/menaquinone biosynthesis C-methylase UbiE
MSDFNHIAKNYDSDFTQSFVGKYQRNWVWKLVDKELGEHFEVLELNAGTGEDALHFAAKVKNYLATDISSEMISVAAEKCQNHKNIQLEVADFKQALQGEQKYDLIFSNFGGLNCISPKELQNLAPHIKSCLKKSGSFIAVVMGRDCKWEQRYYKKKKEPQKALRRKSKDAVQANVEGKSVDTWYFTPMEFAMLLDLKITKLKPVGYAIPPSYLNPWLEPKTLLRSGLKWADILTRNMTSLSNKADHYFIKLVHENPA